MTAVVSRPVPGSRAAAPERLQWLAPAPLWNENAVGQAAAGLAQPWIAELTSDQFIPEFLGILAGTGGSSPADLAATVPDRTLDGVAGAPFKLFQPLGQRYYVVAASLVCRRPGIPDHAVRPARKERTTFVMRRIDTDGVESAWVPEVGSSASGTMAAGSPPSGSWQPAVPDALVSGEEQLPMHAAPVGAFAEAGSTAAALGMAAGSDPNRTVFYGYVPVGRRERMVTALPDAEVLTRLAQLNATLPDALRSDPIADELTVRVINPLIALCPPATPTAPAFGSLYLLLDLGDWLQTYLPELHAAIVSGATTISGTNRQTLLNLLRGIAVVTSPPGAVPKTTVPLTQAIVDLLPYAALVHGADIKAPPTTYDLNATDMSTLPANGLFQLATASRGEESAPVAPSVPPELSGLIKDDPIYVAPGTPQPVYVIRAVFSHDPCLPVLSAPTHPFVLARATDGDAPARKIRIQLPDIVNLRQFQRGVALEMPPALTALMNKVTPDILRGTGPASGDIGLGMICSFSIQIIFMCAFIVLFVFLLLLNIVFWWMPFLKICFPVPTTSTAQGPRP